MFPVEPWPAKIAVFGSRHPTPEMVAHLERSIATLPRDVTVITGGAIGIDQIAARLAKARGLKVLTYLPDYATFGRRAPLERNQRMAETCDAYLAFHLNNSPGTRHFIRTANSLQKPGSIFSRP